MDIGKAFTYVFDDPNWIQKIVIGGIVLFIPIVNFAAIGYMLNALRNVAEGQVTPLPEWGDFGNHFMRGLYAFIGMLIYFLPLIIVVCCIGIVTAVLGSSTSQTGTDGSSNNLAGVAGIIILCLECIAGLYAFVAGVTLYAPLTRFAMSANQLSVFWDFRNNLELIQKNAGAYILALIIGFVASFVAGFGTILCIIGVLFTSFWAQLVYAHLFGQFWQQTQGPAQVPVTTTIS